MRVRCIVVAILLSSALTGRAHALPQFGPPAPALVAPRASTLGLAEPSGRAGWLNLNGGQVTGLVMLGAGVSALALGAWAAADCRDVCAGAGLVVATGILVSAVGLLVFAITSLIKLQAPDTHPWQA